MAKRQIDYGRMVEQALRTVVRDVLIRVGKEGLHGQHHFYVTFKTTHPDVDIADYLKARYPTEMTIVLQHQFWGLEIDEAGFAVTLSFNNAAERLRIPFAALTVFADPAAEFGLQFTLDDEARVVALPAPERPALAPPQGPAEVVPLNRGDADGVSRRAELPADTGPDPTKPGAKIVTLDRFRKK